MTQVQFIDNCPSFTPIKYYMTKQVIIFMTDSDTGELIAGAGVHILKQNKMNLTFNCSSQSSKSGESVCRTWFDSFMRGVSQDKNLSLEITIKNASYPSCELDIF